MHRPAFTPLEVLLVVSIIGVLGVSIVPMYRNYQTRSDLDNAVQQITQSLGRARIQAINGVQDAIWGVYTPQAVLFKGASYAARDTAFDETYPISLTISVTGLQEVTYSRLKGAPSSTGTIVLTAITGEQKTINIIITRQGIPTISEDHLTICHCSNNNGSTKTIPDNAWPGHRGHGDHLGVCTQAANECD